MQECNLVVVFKAESGKMAGSAITPQQPKAEEKELRLMHSQLVVLGGGPGGYAAAFMAAEGHAMYGLQ